MRATQNERKWEMRFCLKSGQRPTVVAFEIGDGSEEESAAIPSGVGTVGRVRTFFGSTDPEKTLTEFGVSELEAMAKAKADGIGPNLNVGTGSRIVHVPSVRSSSVHTAVEAARTKFHPS